MRIITSYNIIKQYVSQSIQFGPKWQFFCLKPILFAIFVTIATVKVKQTPGFFTWAILLIIQSEEIDEKQLSVFGSRKNQISPLMHVALSALH